MKKIILLACGVLFSLQAMPNVPFDQSMSSCWDYHPQVAAQDEGWQFIRSLYEDYQANFQLSEEYKIPKLIHLVWLGSPLPERCKAIVASWERFHPDWVVKVWTDEDAASFHLTNQEAFDRAKNYGEKSDIFRYEVLYRYGGLYADTDFECLKSFDELHRSCEFYCGIAQNGVPYLLIGLIGSVPGHPILKATIDNLRTGAADWDLERIMRETGVYFFTKKFFEQAPLCPKNSVVPLPVSFLYPFPGGERHRRDIANIKKEFLKPESMAIHYFATSWQ